MIAANCTLCSLINVNSMIEKRSFKYGIFDSIVKTDNSTGNEYFRSHCLYSCLSFVFYDKLLFRRLVLFPFFR